MNQSETSLLKRLTIYLSYIYHADKILQTLAIVNLGHGQSWSTRSTLMSRNYRISLTANFLTNFHSDRSLSGRRSKNIVTRMKKRAKLIQHNRSYRNLLYCPICHKQRCIRDRIYCKRSLSYVFQNFEK